MYANVCEPHRTVKAIAPARILALVSLRPLFFFDLDDTLLDHRAAEEAAQRITFDSQVALFRGVPYEEWLARYRASNLRLWEQYSQGAIDRATLSRRRFTDPLRDLGLDARQGEAVGAIYLEEYGRQWRLMEGAEEILEHASREGVVGILSNGFRDLQRRKIARFGLERWARHVILSEEVGAMKPAREIFDAAWKAGASGAAVRKVYVGDSFATDVVGAKNAGWFPILFDRHGKGAPAPVVFVTRLVDLKPLLA
jgi:FMN phosphatase YigB (HAD superfamily)